MKYVYVVKSKGNIHLGAASKKYQARHIAVQYIKELYGNKLPQNIKDYTDKKLDRYIKDHTTCIRFQDGVYDHITMCDLCDNHIQRT